MIFPVLIENFESAAHTKEKTIFFCKNYGGAKKYQTHFF